MTGSSRTGSMLTEIQVGRLLGVDTTTVRQWCNQGVIRLYDITPRGDQLFSLREVVDLLTKLKANSSDDNGTEDG